MRPLLLALLLASCSDYESRTAVDACYLRDVLESCAQESSSEEERAACERSARGQATRIAAGIPEGCRE